LFTSTFFFFTGVSLTPQSKNPISKSNTCQKLWVFRSGKAHKRWRRTN
jgi:hypothetical protein